MTQKKHFWLQAYIWLSFWSRKLWDNVIQPISMFTEILSSCTNSSPFTSKKAQISSAPFLKTTLCLYGRRQTCISSIHSNFNLYISRQNLNGYHWAWSFSFFFQERCWEKLFLLKFDPFMSILRQYTGIYYIHQHLSIKWQGFIYSKVRCLWG